MIETNYREELNNQFGYIYQMMIKKILVSTDLSFNMIIHNMETDIKKGTQIHENLISAIKEDIKEIIDVVYYKLDELNTKKKGEEV